MPICLLLWSSNKLRLLPHHLHPQPQPQLLLLLRLLPRLPLQVVLMSSLLIVACTTTLI
jgi:hypothetical protein